VTNFPVIRNRRSQIAKKMVAGLVKIRGVALCNRFALIHEFRTINQNSKALF